MRLWKSKLKIIVGRNATSTHCSKIILSFPLYLRISKKTYRYYCHGSLSYMCIYDEKMSPRLENKKITLSFTFFKITYLEENKNQIYFPNDNIKLKEV